MRYEVEDVEKILKKYFFDPELNFDRMNPFDTLTYKFISTNPVVFETEYNIVMEKVKILLNAFETKVVDLKCEAIIDKYVHKGPKVKSMSFYTIVPKERLEFNQKNIDKFCQFANILFGPRYRTSYNKVWWVIECGKHEDNPNLHLHALIDFDQSKNFKRNLLSCWKKTFPLTENRICYNENGNTGIHRVPCNTQRIQDDKVKYLTNENKGSHENFKDLGLSGFLDYKTITSHN